MKKVYLKLLLAICASSVFAYVIVYACADGYWDSHDNSGFTPEAFVDSAYKPFFYDPDLAYYGIGHDDQHNSRFNEKNVQDWKAYFGNKIPAKELDYFLNIAGVNTVDSAAAYINSNSRVKPASAASFLLLQQKDAASVKKFFTYLNLAKSCESFACTVIDYWGDNDASKKDAGALSNINSVSKEVNGLFEKETDKFIKQRYWFQLVRSYFFSESWNKCISSFDTYKNDFSRNEIYYRAMAYMAGAYYKQHIYAKANYYYSLVYAGCDAMKVPAHWSFHPQEESDWDAALNLCANNEEKATLWQMLGVFYSDEIRSIKEIYKLDSKSEKLNLLLVRYINQLENGFDFHSYDSYYYDAEPKDFIKIDDGKSAALQLIGSIADAGNTQKPYLWNMAYAYLNFLMGKADIAEKYISRVNTPDDNLLQAQSRLLKLAIKVSRTKTLDPAFESSVLKDFKWLKDFNDAEMSDFRHSGLWNWIRNDMSGKYNRQKEWVKAECFRHSSSFFTDNAKVEGLKALKNSPDRSSYDNLCAELCDFSYADLLEYQAINETFQNNLESAIAKMQQAPEPTVLAGNPFNGGIKDCHDCDHEAPQRVKYNKLSFLLKMKEMKDKIAADQDIYNNAKLLGNAFYNITHFGNARFFYECKIIGSAYYSPVSIDSVFAGKLTKMNMAKYYYNLALKSAQTNEQKAQCQYMLAKCERNEWFNKTFFTDRGNYWNYYNEKGTDFVGWNSFKVLKEQYANTAYYNEVIKECGWFATYCEKK